MSDLSLLTGPGALAARLGWAMALAASLALPGLAVAQSAALKVQLDIFAARTGQPRSWVVSNKPGVVVAIRDRDSLSTRNPAEKVRLFGEIVDDDAADRLGYRSMRSVVEINCETRRDRVTEMEVFGSPNLKGAAQKRTVPGGWVQPSADAYMADVIRAVCRGAPRHDAPPAADIPPPRTALPDAPPRKPVAPPAPPRSSQPSPEPAPMVPAPWPRPVLSPEAPIATAPRLPRLVAPPPAPSPTPAPLPPPPSPAKATSAAAPPPRPRPPPPLRGPAHPAVSGGLTVQIGALDSDADARRALKGVASLTAGGFASRVEPVTVGKRIFYRALVSGFADRADAQAFCAQVARKGGTCFIR